MAALLLRTLPRFLVPPLRLLRLLLILIRYGFSQLRTPWPRRSSRPIFSSFFFFFSFLIKKEILLGKFGFDPSLKNWTRTVHFSVDPPPSPH